LVIDNLQTYWPTDSIPSEWKCVERIENGSKRIHRPSYATPRETEFYLLSGVNLQGGYVYAPSATSSTKALSDFDLKNSSIRILKIK